MLAGVGTTVTVGVVFAAAVPVPPRVTVSGEFAAVDVSVTLPVIEPACDGENSMPKTQPAPGANIAPAEQVVPEVFTVKPLLATTVAILMVCPLTFETVTSCSELVWPALTDPKARDACWTFTSRTRLFTVSAIQRLPDESIAAPIGKFKSASVAGPPSPP
jgi:hypothetical protein